MSRSTRSAASILHRSLRFTARLGRTDVRRRLLCQAVSVLLIITMLAVQTPAASLVIAGAASEWQANFAFWLLKNGWTGLLQGSADKSGGSKLRSLPTPGATPTRKPQEKQADRDMLVHRIQIHPGDVTLRLDERIVFTAVAYDKDDAPVGGVRFTWGGQDTGRDDSQTRVAQSGEFVAQVAGKYKVTVEGAGKKADAQVTVSGGTDGDDTRRVEPRPTPRRISTRDLPPARKVSRLKRRQQSGRGRRTDEPTFVRASFTSTAAPAAAPATATTLLPQEPEWTDYNYVTADDPENQRGNPPGRAVDDGGGSSNFQITAPVLSLPGRGLDLSLALVYNSRVWHMDAAGGEISFDIDRGWPAPGWSLGFGKIMKVGTDNGGIIVDADGSRHGYVGSGTTCGFTLNTNDGTFIDYEGGMSDCSGNGTLIWARANYPNGTRVEYGAPGERAVYPTKITDASGNYLTITYRNNAGPQINTVTDTLSRVVTFHYDSNNLLTAVTAPGLYTGTTRTLVRLHYRQLTLDYGFSGLQPMVRSQTVPVIDAIFYPGTNTGYWFGDPDSYSSYGMLRKVSEQRSMEFSGAPPVPPDQGPTEQGTITAAGITSRQMSYDYPLGRDDSLTDAPGYRTMTETWERMDTGPAVTEYNAQQGASPRRTEVKQADGTRSVQFSYNFASLPWNHPDKFRDGLIYQDETYDSNNRLLSKSIVTWEQGAYESPRPVRTEVTDELGQTTATAFSYGPLYNQVTEVRSYGYDGSLLRKTNTAYENASNYTDRHIFNLVKVNEIYAADGSTRESRTEYEYDASALQNTPDVAQHDNPATAARGNVTRVTTYAAAAVTLGGPVTETRSYDMTGNLVTAAASCCEQTSFSYTLSTQYAYPESQTRGSADSSNPAARVTTSNSYYFNTGLVNYTQDANGRRVFTEYLAETLRVRNYWDESTQSEVMFSYDDGYLAIAETVYNYTPASYQLAKHNVKYLNGRGQVQREEALGTDDVWDVVKTKYDVLGRVAEQTRPYRDGTPQPVGTTTTYDALGRVTEVRAPDGSATTTHYNEDGRPDGASGAPGQTMRMVDAWGKERWGRMDADNRLVEMLEPFGRVPEQSVGNRLSIAISSGVGASYGRVTTYRYNTLSDLTEVEQGDGSEIHQQRRFRYDALGRLTHQKLAETSATLNDAGQVVGAGGQWSDVMSYDERSNLTQRTDARGVKTIFKYTDAAGNQDPLNRLQSVRYDVGASGVAPASTVRYEYRPRSDAALKIDVTQVKKVTAEGINTEEYAYDAIGRLTGKTMTLVSRPAFPMVIDYVLDGLDRVTDVRYPAQYAQGATNPVRKVVHHDYDVASRLSELKVGGASYASQVAYNAASQTTRLKVGPATVSQTYENYTYDAATGLLSGQRVNRGPAILLDLSYDYQRAGTTAGTNLPGRTGQLTRLTDNLNRNKDRGYQYDGLGRLERAIGGESRHWVQAYAYDRFGNRTNVVESVNAENYVSNFYQVTLGRQPSAAELQSWTDRLRTAFVADTQGQRWGRVYQEVQALGAELFGSAAYAARNRTNEQFVTDMYQAYLLRAPEATGLAAWLAGLQQNGGNRATTRASFGMAEEVERRASTVIPPDRLTFQVVPRDGQANVSYDTGTNRINLPGWEYDAAGNQTRVRTAAGVWQRYVYDAANRLVRVTNDGATVLASYTYGATNQRLVTLEGGARTYYVWSGGAVVAEYSESTSALQPQWQKTYIYLGARLLATMVPISNGERVEYHHPDRLGTRLVTNSIDSTSYEQAHLPYGTGLESQSTGATNRRFTSYERSTTTGLDYAVNRHYDANQGRFTQVDPIGAGAASLSDPQTWNMYAYAGSNSQFGN